MVNAGVDLRIISKETILPIPIKLNLVLDKEYAYNGARVLEVSHS